MKKSVILMALVAGSVGAAETPAPVFQNLRYDDNAVTREAAVIHTTFKLNDAASWSAGGQVRVRGESWNNFAFAPAQDDTFVLTRLRLHSDLRLAKGFRIYVEGISALATERDLPGGRRPLDEDSADLLNAFAEGSLTAGGVEATLRAGRQELSYGKQRLISPLDWSNTRRTFDGARLLTKAGAWKADAFATRWVQVQPHDFNDGDSGRDFYGLYATRTLTEGRGALDLYALGLERDTAKFGTVSGAEDRYTLGTRWGGACAGGVDADVEGGYQFGEVGAADVAAWFVAVQVGFAPADCPLKSRWFVGYDLASGDDDPADDEVGTFNQLFPLGHAYFGGIDVVGRQNISDISAGVSMSPLARTTLRVEGHLFARAENADALYDAGGNVVRAGDAGTAHEVGQEVDVVADYKWNLHLNLQAGYSHFFAGDFLSPSGADEDVDFAYASAQYTF